MLSADQQTRHQFANHRAARNGFSVDLIERPSPSNDARSPDGEINILVLHYTGMQSADAALDRLCDPNVDVSAHYLIDEHGAIYRLVPEARRAWHAGVSAWAGSTDINNLSIGIELANPGHEFGYQPFPEEQMLALEALAADILSRHPIQPRHVLGHSDVAPSRKQDPGELFDWRRLATKGIGLWPRSEVTLEPGPVLRPSDHGIAVAATQAAFAAYGYCIEPNGIYDQATCDVVTAFQRHFRASCVDGTFDMETAAILKALLESVS